MSEKTNTTAPLALSAHAGALTKVDALTGKESPNVAEIERLIGLAQSAPSTTRTVEREDGTTDETVVWSADRAADDAMARLVNAYLPLLHNVARRLREQAESKGLDKEEMLGHLLAEFVHYARNRYVIGQATPFPYAIKRILELAFHDREREAGLISIPANTKYRFLQLLKKHEGDFAAAYADCKSGKFTPETFMAVYNALNVADNSLDGSRFSGSYDESEDGPSPLDETLHRSGHYTNDPADMVAQQALVTFAFAQIDDPKVAQALRLKFGFDDVTTHSLRVAAGFDAYDAGVMKDEDVARIVGIRRSTLNRKINAALAVMRAAIEATDYDGVSHRSAGRVA